MRESVVVFLQTTANYLFLGFLAGFFLQIYVIFSV